jgi:hypothetical protein
MKHIKATLRALQIFDSSNKLSITSIAMMVIIVKLALAPTLDWAIITAFFLSCLNYTGKKLINRSAENKSIGDIERITSVEEAIRQVKNALALKK